MINKWFNVDSVEVYISEEFKRFVDVNDFFSNDKFVCFSGVFRDLRFCVLLEIFKDGKCFEGIWLFVEYYVVVVMECVIYIMFDCGGLFINVMF